MSNLYIKLEFFEQSNLKKVTLSFLEFKTKSGSSTKYLNQFEKAKETACILRLRFNQSKIVKVIILIYLIGVGFIIDFWVVFKKLNKNNFKIIKK